MSLSTIQEMFLINISSNAGQDCTRPDIEQQVYKEIQDYLSQHNLADTWQVAWGPLVYIKDYSTTPDAVMYLALDATNKRYFLSVAGTNYDSLLGFYEDLDVGHTEPWPYPQPQPDIQVASGTMLALSYFTANTALARIGDAGATGPVTLPAYLTAALAGADADSYAFIAGGHSLGGAVSPLVALWLADTQSDWDSKKAIGSFAAYTSAGPTIGTASFKTYYNARIPNTTRIHNTLDVVTLGWNSADLQTIPRLYAPQIGESDCVDWLVGRAEAKVSGLNYEQVGTIDYPLTGQVNAAQITWYYPPGINFGVQLGYQHIDAYFHLLDLEKHLTANIAADPVKNASYWKGVAASLRAFGPAASSGPPADSPQKA